MPKSPRTPRPPRATGLSPTALGWALAMVLGLAGCCPPKGPEPVSVIHRPGPPPDAAGVLSVYNARVRRLEALKAGALVSVRGKDGRGKAFDEQVEGFLQIVRPRKVALRIDKLSQTYFWLGSDDDRYWWLDLSADEKIAMAGHHARATPESAARFGIPVHPLDLQDLLAVTPIEPTATTAWTRDGRLIALELPPRAPGFGPRRVCVDEHSFEPRRVELLDSSGEVVASADLRELKAVDVAGEAFAGASVPTRATISLPGLGVTVELQLHTLENPGAARIKPGNFDLARLLQQHRVTREINLDEQGPDEHAPHQPDQNVPETRP